MGGDARLGIYGLPVPCQAPGVSPALHLQKQDPTLRQRTRNSWPWAAAHHTSCKRNQPHCPSGGAALRCRECAPLYCAVQCK